MAWWQTAPLILLAAALLIVPGLLFTLAVRVRGLAAYLTAPLFSVSVAGLLTLVYPVFNVRWSIPSLAIGTLGVAALAGLCRFLIVRRWPDPRIVAVSPGLVLTCAVSLLCAGFLIAVQMGTAFQTPESISQTYDNVFHLNAVKFAVDSGNASPLNLGSFTGISAYPSAWHALASLLAGLPGVSIPVATSVTNIAIGAIVWPASCVYLALTVAGQRPAVVVLGAILSPAFTSFPLLMVDWGVLYPNLLSISLLPAAIGILFTALKKTRIHRPSTPVSWILVLVAAAGVAMAHPSTLMALVAFGLPAVILGVAPFAIRLRAAARAGDSRGFKYFVAGCVLALAGLFALWRLFRPPAGSASWGAVETPSQVIGEILFNSPMSRPPAVIISIFVWLGVWICLRERQNLHLLGTYVVGSILFFYAAGLDASPRWFLTGVWYFDSYRLAALMPVAVFSLSILGGIWSWDRGRAWLRQRASQSKVISRLSFGSPSRIVALAGLVVLVFFTQYGVMTAAVQAAHWSYRATEVSGLLTPAEERLLNRLASHVEPDAAIAGLPSSGTALAYAYSGRKVIQPHILTTHGEDVDLVNAGLKDAAEFEEVCKAVRELNVKYVLDFGTRTVTGTLPGYGGLMDLHPNASLELVDSEGAHAKLFRVKACWG